MTSSWWKILRVWFAGSRAAPRYGNRRLYFRSSFAASHPERFLHHFQVSGQEYRRAQRDASVSSGIVVAEIAEADCIGCAAVAYRTFVCGIVLQLFGFGHWILGPTQVHASEVGFLGGQSDGRFFGLVVNLHLGIGIDFGRERIDVHGGEEGGRFYDSVPAEWINPVWVG